MAISKLKKYLFSLGIFISFSWIHGPFLSAEIPQEMYGIWEGKDRYVFFETVENKTEDSSFVQYEDRIVIILKDFYGWYLDRVVEHEDYGKKYKRDINDATTKKSVLVLADASPLWLSEGHSFEDSAAYELELVYGKNEKAHVPFALINDKIFLEFWIQNANYPGFWQGNVISEGIKVSNQVKKENLWSWYINPQNQSEIYRIRYWISNMEYDSQLEASIGDINIPKQILSAENVYACVPGRRTNVRNLDKNPAEKAFDGRSVIFNEEKTLAAADNVYLQKLVDKKTFEDLMEIVRVQNAKRKPDPPPLFPPSDLDFHWDIIELIEKDNAIIQAFRKG